MALRANGKSANEDSAFGACAKARAAREQVQICTPEGRRCGSVRRFRLRQLRLWHFASYVFVFDDSDRLCVQKRTQIKDVFPGAFDLSAGGVLAAGEARHIGARREVFEELGVSAPLNFTGSFQFGALHVHGDIFWTRWTGPIRPQPEEVEATDWLDIADALALQQVTPDTRAALVYLLASPGCPVGRP
ncbi:NUDIX domain-containing protein [Larsenimonas suaedae]|uniref:NUDIX domain-containing protein n=1 Tax=Larsenimonas suaedae TaxID=1851019 RepID=A0ABU1GT02_9GAMM|nr:NUDIX domain-containing protein [Larsenimonas suaedae]MCM2972063.1 NUDIX domain-containing protein [Larsenimonas suaedae]MDR5895143.1 NUDIX domain-containing protein [Larsenimonas suaedae]